MKWRWFKKVIFELRGGNKHLDFEHRCCFRGQLDYKDLIDGNGEIVEVPMESGKIGLYKVTSERYNVLFDDTGQRNWFFKFLRYRKQP